MNAQMKFLQQWFGRHAALAQGLAAPMLVVLVLVEQVAVAVRLSEVMLQLSTKGIAEYLLVV